MIDINTQPIEHIAELIKGETIPAIDRQLSPHEIAVDKSIPEAFTTAAGVTWFRFTEKDNVCAEGETGFLHVPVKGETWVVGFYGASLVKLWIFGSSLLTAQETPGFECRIISISEEPVLGKIHQAQHQGAGYEYYLKNDTPSKRRNKQSVRRAIR